MNEYAHILKPLRDVFYQQSATGTIDGCTAIDFGSGLVRKFKTQHWFNIYTLILSLNRSIVLSLK